jgi:hypothetical protein
VRLEQNLNYSDLPVILQLRICFERARLQPCRKHRRKRAGFSP